MGPDTKNNGAAGHQGPVKIELRKGEGLLSGYPPLTTSLKTLPGCSNKIKKIHASLSAVLVMLNTDLRADKTSQEEASTNDVSSETTLNCHLDT